MFDLISCLSSSAQPPLEGITKAYKSMTMLPKKPAIHCQILYQGHQTSKTVKSTFFCFFSVPVIALNEIWLEPTYTLDLNDLRDKMQDIWLIFLP